MPPLTAPEPGVSPAARRIPLSRYEPCIDGWRGLAAGMVLVAHFFPLRAPPNTWLHLGQTGVTIFFVISGYLISLILFRAREDVAAGHLTKRQSLGRFYIRRTLRIAPIYFASVLGMCALGAQPIRDHVWWLLTYTSNFGAILGGIDFKNATHFWTLAVEEQFYLVWPLMMLSVPQRVLGGIVRALLPCSAIACLIAGALGASFGLLVMLPVGGASVALGYGALLAHARFYQGCSPRHLARVSIFLGLPFFLGSQVLWWWSGGQPAMQVFAYRLIYPWAAVLFWGWLFQRSLESGSHLNRMLSHPVPRYFGRISYGLYVYHFLLDPYYYSFWRLLGLHGPLDPISEGLLKSATAMAIAAASWHVLEKPILALKDRCAPEPKIPQRPPIDPQRWEAA